MSKIPPGSGRVMSGLSLQRAAESLADTSVLSCVSGGHAYTVEVGAEREPGCEAGLLLYYNTEHACGIHIAPNGVAVRLADGYIPETGINVSGSRSAQFRNIRPTPWLDHSFR